MIDFIKIIKVPPKTITIIKGENGTSKKNIKKLMKNKIVYSIILKIHFLNF